MGAGGDIKSAGARSSKGLVEWGVSEACGVAGVRGRCSGTSMIWTW